MAEVNVSQSKKAAEVSADVRAPIRTEAVKPVAPSPPVPPPFRPDPALMDSILGSGAVIDNDRGQSE